MAATEKVRWGVIGATARIAGSAVLPAICCSEWAELTAVASRSMDKARDIATECDTDNVTAYGDYDSLIADSAVEAIYIPLPNNLHLEWAVEALNNGKHVLCEKPLALNAAEAAEMVETAQHNRVILSEAFMYRYHPLQQEIFNRIAQGAIGAIRHVRCRFSFVQVSAEDYRRDPSMGGGALLDIGCYGVHIARTAFGREPSIVTGKWSLDDTSGVDLSAAAELDFGTGCTGHVECAFASGFEASYEIAGDSGKVAVTKFFGEGREVDASYTLTLAGGAPQVTTVLPGNMYIGEIDAMSRRIRGEDVFLLAAEDGYLNMRVLDAIAASARTVQPVVVDSND